MTRAIALVAAAASVLLMAACAPAPQLPAPMTQAEAEKYMDDSNRAWWTSMFPDEPMPVVDPIDSVSTAYEQTECLKNSGVEGVTFGSDGSWSTAVVGTDALNAVNRAQFICALQYPYDLSEPGEMGLLSDAETEWIWNYNQRRLVPCLQTLGYTVTNHLSDYAEGSHTLWIVYFEMAPLPSTDAEWARIDLRCPPSPIGPTYRPMVSG